MKIWKDSVYGCGLYSCIVYISDVVICAAIYQFFKMFAIPCLLLVLFLGETQAINRTGLLQFGEGIDATLQRGDDTLARIRLPSQFTFYGTNYTDIFVS